MKHETFALFAVSIFELKLDQATMLEWRWDIQRSKTVPDFDDLLEVLDLFAGLGKNAAWEENVKYPLQKGRPSQDHHRKPA